MKKNTNEEKLLTVSKLQDRTYCLLKELQEIQNKVEEQLALFENETTSEVSPLVEKELEELSLQLKKCNREIAEEKAKRLQAEKELLELNEAKRLAIEEIYNLASTKSFKLLHLFSRFKYQAFNKDKKERKAFRKWFFSRLKNTYDEDRRFNPVFNILSILNNKKEKVDGYWLVRTSERIDIITTPHTKYIAELIRDSLKKCCIESVIHVGDFQDFRDIPYIIICPQFLKKFPKLYIAVQMEQTVSSRWLTPEYFEILRNAYVVFDYSLENIRYFKQFKDIGSKFYYLPIDINRKELLVNRCLDSVYEYDVVFYGDNHSDRRERFLSALSKKVNVKIINNLFGEDLLNELRKAKIIVNVHYYENSLLETTRLSEILSLGKNIIVSERSMDPNEEAAWNGLVDFVDINDFDSLIDRVEYWRSHENERVERLKQNNDKILSQIVNKTDFFFERFLLANDRISFDTFYENVGGAVEFKGNRICLTLPESLERREDFLSDNRISAEMFYGLRHVAGWCGCAMSYKFIARKALEQHLGRVLICEDDVFFDDAFSRRFKVISDYLESNTDWDVFCGVMADLKHIKILDVSEVQDEKIVHMDKMISMVFNIYSENALYYINKWNERDRDIQKNTIDRYLGHKEINVLTTAPFLVGHKEDMKSTIWGFKNTQYSEMLTESSKKICEAVDEILAQKHKTCIKDTPK